jgi:hypothetical protein
MRISLSKEIEKMRREESEVLDFPTTITPVEQEEKMEGQTEDEVIAQLEGEIGEEEIIYNALTCEESLEPEIETEEKVEETPMTMTSTHEPLNQSTNPITHTVVQATDEELLRELHLRESKKKAQEEMLLKEALFLLEEEERNLIERLKEVKTKIKHFHKPKTHQTSDGGPKRKKSRGFKGKNIIDLISQNITSEVFKPVELVEKLKPEFEGPENSLTTIINQTLAKMISQGKVTRESRGHYKFQLN